MVTVYCQRFWNDLEVCLPNPHKLEGLFRSGVSVRLEPCRPDRKSGSTRIPLSVDILFLANSIVLQKKFRKKPHGHGLRTMKNIVYISFWPCRMDSCASKASMFVRHKLLPQWRKQSLRRNALREFPIYPSFHRCWHGTWTGDTGK